MNSPRVSVILPVGNGAGTVARALESVRRQSFADWELIAVDDGSTDNTSAVLREFARREPRLRLLAQPQRGLVPALHAALAATRGPLIARMDADDECHPERLAAQVALLDAQPGLGLAGTLVEFGGDRAASAGFALHVDWLNSLVAPEEIALNRFVESPFAHPSVMFRRELLERHGSYHEGDFPEDYELWLRWLDAGVRMAKVPRVLLTWNDPPARLSRTDARYDPEAFYRCKAPFLARAVLAVAQQRPVLVWGAGRPTRRRAELLTRHGLAISGYIDIDLQKVGREFANRRVLGVDEIPGPERAFVLGYVARRGARELARGHLGARGYVEGRDFLMAA